MQCLNRIFNGNQDVIQFLQRASGYSLTGNTGEQCFFLCYGTGQNGKSTVLTVFKRILGDYATEAATDTLMVKKFEGIPSDIARLQHRRLVTAVESEEGKQLKESLIKAMTGGENLVARYLYQDYFEFRPAFKLWLGTNHRPAITGTDHAIWRRVKMIPFTETIPEDDLVNNYEEVLLREAPGILNWMLEGCRMWQEAGLNPPAEVIAATAAYRAEMDVLGDYIKECVEKVPGEAVQSTDLYSAFRQWCQRIGERELTQTLFSRRMKERGFIKERRRRAVFWLNIRLRTLGAVEEDERIVMEDPEPSE